MPGLHFDEQTILLNMTSERYKHLDNSLKPEKTIMFMHDFINNNMRIAKQPLKTMFLAANEYLIRDEIFEELDITGHARLFGANATISADVKYFIGPIIYKELQYLSKRID